MVDINETNRDDYESGFLCPKCGGKVSTCRHMYAKRWCNECGYVLREEGDQTTYDYIKHLNSTEEDHGRRKIRTGFVSNSSSSSFIVIGAKIDEEKESLVDQMDDISSIWIDDAGTLIAGKVLDDDEYIGDGEMSFEQIKKTVDDVSELLQVDKSEVKLYYGTRPC